MRRFLFLCLSFTFLMIGGNLWAQKISMDDAKQRALQFFAKSSTLSKGKKKVPRKNPRMVTALSSDAYYIFNDESNGGFVVVSGDSRTRSILGFSESGTFDATAMPANMYAWLQGYADEISWLQRQDEDGRFAMATVSNQVSDSERLPIAPLVTTTWNQGVPYNNKTPQYKSGSYYYRSATGCVATAMAQVMKFHQWPQAETAVIPGYTTSSYNMSLSSLAATTFNWEKMRDSYSDDYTTEEADAVATLMKYCGWSVMMDYGPQSGSRTDLVADALKYYFDYDSITTQYVSRSYYTYSKWVDLIYHELKNSRPVVYGGQSSGGGHEFVCDGYVYEDSTDFFHINWGWGGVSDDYFVLSALDPEKQGIGGSTSADGFHYGQDAVIGIQKPSEGGTVADIAPNVLDLTLNAMNLSSDTVFMGELVSITLNITNNSADDYDGDIYLGLKTIYNGQSSYSLLEGSDFSIPAGQTKDCVFTYRPETYGVMNFVLYLPNTIGSYTTDGEVAATLTVLKRETNIYVPVYGSYCDEYIRSQFIVPAADLKEILYAQINGMTFSSSLSSVGWGEAEFDVYLSEVGDTSFSDTTLYAWSLLERVYAGNLSVNDYQMKIDFDVPYQYMGKNLLVGIRQTKSGDYAQSKWYGMSAIGASLGGRESKIQIYDFLPAVVFDTTPDVAPVGFATDVTIDYAGGQEATVTWTCDVAACDICLNDSLIENVSSPYKLTGLEYATSYIVKVRGRTDNEASRWSIPVRFNTELAEEYCQITLTLTDTYGDGWSGNAIKIVDALSGIEIGTYTNENLNETKGFSENEQNIHLVRVPSGRDIQFLWVAGSYSSIPSECMWSVSDVNDEVLFSGKGSNSLTTGDILFTYHVDCTVTPWRSPSNLIVKEIGSHSVVLEWTENSLVPATEWVVAYKTDSMDSYEEVTTSNNPFTLEGLKDETTYMVKVKPATDEVEKWSDLVYFTTEVICPIPVIVDVTPAPTKATISWTGNGDVYNVRYRRATSVPVVFSDDFENGLGQWTIYTEGEAPQTDGWVSNSSSAHSGTHSAIAWSWKSLTTYNADNWLVTPQVAFGNELRFWVRTRMAYPDSCEVLLSTTGNVIENFTDTLRAMGAASDNNDWTEINIDLSRYTGQQGYIAIHHVSSDCFSLEIDDFAIYGEADTVEWTNASTEETSIELTGLSPETTYEFQMQAVNSEGSSKWTDLHYFTTMVKNPLPVNIHSDLMADGATLRWTGYGDSYNVQYRTTANDDVLFFEDFEELKGSSLPEGWTTIDNDGDGNNWFLFTPSDIIDINDIKGVPTVMGRSCVTSASYNKSALTPDNWLITPLLNLQGTMRVYLRSQDPEWPVENFAIYLSTSGTSVEDFSTELVPETTATSNYVAYTADLSAYDGRQGYIAIRHFNSTDQFRLNVDNFGLYGTSSAPAGEWQEITVTDTVATLSGLPTNNGYEYRIRSIVDGEPGEWTESGEFALITLRDEGVNSKMIINNQGKKAHVTLAGRTLKKDKNWNTITLPFNLTLEGSSLDGAVAKTLNKATMDASCVTMTFSDSLTYIQAGVPYFVKWDEGEDIVNPVFSNVVICSKEGRHLSYAMGNVKFVGNYDAFSVDTLVNNGIYYMAGRGIMRHADNGYVQKACQAYLEFSDEATKRWLTIDLDDPMPLGTITGKNYTREYGDVNPVFEFTTEGITLEGTPEIFCEATATSPVGTYDIILRKGTVENYYNVKCLMGTLTITKAPLTIAAGTYTKEQWEEMPEFTLTYTGFKNNETEDVLIKQPTVSCEATVESAPGEYPVTVSGAKAQNYDISYTNGKLTVLEGPEPYAALSNGNTVLTFYYDKKKEERHGMNIGPFNPDFFVWDDERGWGDVASLIKRVVFDKTFAEYKGVTSIASWFNGCEKLTTIDGIANLNTSNVTDMSFVFDGCSSLTRLDLSNFNTSNVTDMTFMFRGCSSLTRLDISSFNTSKVTNMGWMFLGCSCLTSLDLSSYNTLNLTAMNGLFKECSSLTSLDLSSFDTSNVTEMIDVFYGCSSLTNLDLSNFCTSNVTNMYAMFSGCSSLTRLDVSSFNTSNVTNMYAMFSGCSSLTRLDVSSFNTSNVTYMGWMFSGCSSLTRLDLSSFNTSNVTDMDGMFSDCSSLTRLDLSSFNTSNVTDMYWMFSGCSSLTSLDVSNFNTSNVTSMWYMFKKCSSLPSLDLSSFNTSNVTDMGEMFFGCSALEAIYVGEKWSTKDVTNSEGMFTGCTKLVGGMGTAYSSAHTDATYARIDGGTKAPGYFTEYNSTGITDILASGEPFDVYTINGQMVRSHVTSLKGLSKGIYMVKGKKIIVK